MNRILIVDDDTIVRLYLTEIVNWESYDLEVVGSARNGEEALEMVHNLDPDIVLTDIEMPKMNGIQLINQLREEGYDGLINVLSCYDDFELVKSAMQEGADDYLLKNNLNDHSINDFITKIKERLAHRQRQSAHRNSLQNLAAKGLKVMRSEILADIMRGELTGKRLEEQLKHAEIRGKYQRIITVFIRPLGADQLQMDGLMNLCEQRMSNEKAEMLHAGEGTLALLIDLSDEPSERKGLELSNRLQTMIQKLTVQYLNLQVALGSSAICDGKNAIALSLQQADRTIRNCFFGPGRWRYGFDPAVSSDLPIQAVDFLRVLSELLAEADDHTIKRMYEEALSAIRKYKTDRDTVIRWLQDCDQKAELRRPDLYYNEKHLLEEFAPAVEDYLELRNQKMSSKVPPTAGPTIRRAVRYIYDHFGEPISQTLVSGHVNLTPAYFSTLFKQEMGIGFSEFITSVRLEWVCNRIKTTSLTIKQISEEAGFPDYPYFCKTFKKAFGMSPAEYRRSNNI
ncbi:MAG: response regulator [Lachnospiraceae bacterium]|nr:response regulator [Lachnospiraceae bacterium]